MDRDYLIMHEINRWRFCLSRHIRFLAGFAGQRATDRRLKLLIEAGYIRRRKIIYGVPSLYYLTYKGKILNHLPTKQDKVRIEQVTHDIAVLDTAIYFLLKENIPLADITTEKELHSLDGFSIRKHRPDFVFTKDGKKYCVEVELNRKSKERFEKNLQDNFMEYDYQKWIVPHTQVKIIQLLKDNEDKYPIINIIHLEEVTNFVRQYQ